MKRLLAFVTATLILALCLCVPASAGSCYADTVTKTVPLWSADTAVAPYWSNFGSFELDTQNQVEGAGCLNADFSKSHNFSARFAIPEIDTTGFTALELDIYISDLAIWDWLKSTYSHFIMISSAGDARLFETQHTRWLILESFEGANGSPKVGWNHIVLFLEDRHDPALHLDPSVWGDLQYTPVDMSHINYLHLELGNDRETADPSWVLKLDNLVFTDRQKGNHAFDEWLDMGSYHKSECRVCKAYSEDNHTFDEWEYDESNHWAHCSSCPMLESKPHDFNGFDGDETEHWRKCTWCDYRADVSGHTYATWEYNTDSHWGYCVYCGVCTTELHQYGEYTVITEPTETEDGLQFRSCSMCSYVEEEIISKTETSTPNSPDTGTADSGCTGVIGGAWSVITSLSLAGWMLRKKKK
jgi:hypothetical protein